MDIFNAVLSLMPEAKFSLCGDEYENIVWFDENEFPPPSKEEVLIEAERLQEKLKIQQIENSRSVAYRQEADPLFFKYQRGEATKEEWEAKIEEIRQRYPYSS